MLLYELYLYVVIYLRTSTSLCIFVNVLKDFWLGLWNAKIRTEKVTIHLLAYIVIYYMKYVVKGQQGRIVNGIS